MYKLTKKILIIGCIVTLISLCICTYSYFKKSSNIHDRISFHSALQKTKEIEKLFTGIYLVYVLDKSYGLKKRDIPSHFFNRAVDTLYVMSHKNHKSKKVIKGFCKKRYEVYMGYDNLTDLLQNSDIIENACHGRTDKLPNPKILAVNCKNTDARGDYKGDGMCYRWDREESLRNDVLLAQMRDDNILEKVNKRGRESLKTIANLFCE